MSRVESQPFSVHEMIALLSPPGKSKDYILATIRAFCDESYDSKNRVYSMAGYLAHEKQWRLLQRPWKRRLLPLKKFGVEYFHAADCESGVGDFRNVPREDCRSLKIAVTNLAAKRKLHAFCAALMVQHYKEIAKSSSLGAQVFKDDPYFWVFQTVIGSICVYVRDHMPKAKVIFMFDRQEEFSGRAKQLYDEVVQLNPEFAPYMGPLSYGDKREFVPLQAADNLAYESMKTVLNFAYDPQREPRKAMGVLLPQVEKFKLFNRDGMAYLLREVANGRAFVRTRKE